MKDVFSEYLSRINKNNEYPLFDLFDKTDQDSLWHSEGNVKIHTNMVMNELLNLNEYAELCDSEKRILIYSALFHDYAKPITTRSILRDGFERIIAPKHEVTAASLLFFASKPKELSHHEWISVINLVKSHDLLKKSVIHGCHKKYFYNSLIESDSNRLLYILEKADVLGRECADKNEQIEIVEMFKEFCIDYSLWDKFDMESEINRGVLHIKEKRKDITENQAKIIFKKHINSLIRGFSYHIDEEISKSYSYFGKEKKSFVTILCGISGSGKTSFTKNNFDKKTKIISLDEIRYQISGSVESQKNNDEVKRIAYNKLKECLQNGDDCVWDATNIRFDFRKKILDMCDSYNGTSRILLFNNQIENVLKLDKKRCRVVGSDVILDQIKRFQIPLNTEADEVVTIINSSANKRLELNP